MIRTSVFSITDLGPIQSHDSPQAAYSDLAKPRSRLQISPSVEGF